MNTFLGLDPVAGQEFANSLFFNAFISSMRLKAKEMNIDELRWEGPDSAEFKTQFKAHSRDLVINFRRLMELAQELELQIQQQELTSAERNFSSNLAFSAINTLVKTNTGIKQFPPIGKVNKEAVNQFSKLTNNNFINTLGQIKWLNLSIAPSTLVETSTYPPGLKATELSDLILLGEETRNFNNGGPEYENYRIQKVMNADGQIGYRVFIPPTAGNVTDGSAWNGAQGNSLDWANNVRITSDMQTSAEKNLIAAMEKEIPKGANVLIYGHSQGGLLGSKIAGNTELNGEDGWNITHVFSIGAPAQNFIPAQSTTQIYNVEHDFSSAGGIKLSEVKPHLNSISSGCLSLNSNQYKCLASVAPVMYKISNFRIGLDPIPDLDRNIEHPQIHNLSIDAAENHKTNSIRLINLNPFGIDNLLSEAGESLSASHGSVEWLEDGTIDMRVGYYPTVFENQYSNPELITLHGEIDGLYLGEDVEVVSDVNYQYQRDN